MKSPALSHTPAPDERIEVPGARADLWWSHTPDLNGEKTGAIGAFEADSRDSALRALAAAEDRLRRVGVRLVLGPMDGSTWRRYRWVTHSDGRGPFFLEPWNPPEYPLWWREAGFSRLAGYSSSVLDPSGPPAASPALRARFDQNGFTIREMDVTRIRDELRVLHAISLRAFTGNFLYTPLPEEAFLADYGKIEELLDPQCVLIVEHAGEPCAFLFGIPDQAARQRGEKPALIAKTIAVLPSRRRHGIGAILLDELNAIARRKGFREVIHALQHEDNRSLSLTARYPHRVFRGYGLFTKTSSIP